ncbi:MAG TPA: AAA domain-containing protein [Ktedonobacterales bacterium]|nr:AAA domain-containing protein [Ktedonobacterales bacterium]
MAAAESVTEPRSEPACFLCPWEDQPAPPCDLATLSGELRDATRNPASRQLELTIRAESGETIVVCCGEQGRALWSALSSYPPDRWRGLRAHIHHLERTTTPQTLQLLPAGVIVLEPDLLLNITDINNAEYCVRQYPLRRMTPSPPGGASLRGTLVHQAFKEMLKGDGQPIEVALKRALEAARVDLALRHISEEEMAAQAVPHVRALAAWYASSRQNLWHAAPDIRAETFLLAPEVGLKGRLDVLLRDAQGGSLLELKTGDVRASLPKREHRWQVHGYQTLLAARFPGQGSQQDRATLLYSGTPGSAEAHRIPFIRRDLQRVLELRNALALVHATGTVPPPPSAVKCARCMVRQECVRASALLGWQPPDLPGTPEPVDREDAALFAEMYDLMREEARAAEEESSVLWRKTAAERAQQGMALNGLTLDGEPRQTANGEWEYTLAGTQRSDLREGDAVLVSDGDPVRGTVVSGSILRVDARHIVVWTPERIANPTLLDRYESEIVHDRTVRNLWRWLRGAPHLRELVRGAIAPTFDETASEAVRKTLPASLNPEQRHAVVRALSARDYLLIQGPPGTGKTSVVAEIAQRAMRRGERVLIAAFTNQAVDTVLRRLLADGWDDFVRLGQELSVAPEVRGHRLVTRAKMLAGEEAGLTPGRIRETLRAAPLVAATTATWSSDRYDDVGEPLLFDLAILDEATQLTLPATLGALRFARRFVLVGDDRQLPPLVRSETAAARGLKRSLFAALLERWGADASVLLRRQYRMHPTICAFPSAAFYDNKLVADGTARTGQLTLARAIAGPYGRVLDPARPVVFIDVPLNPQNRGHKENEAQAILVHNLVRELRQAGVAAEGIGVIAPYRAQVAAIRAKLVAGGEVAVLVDTVDRFQGGERSVIFYSFGGGGAVMWGGRGSDFLADPYRLNVALTRARHKLILLGNRAALEDIPLLRRLVDYCASLYDGHGGIIPARPEGGTPRRATTPRDPQR